MAITFVGAASAASTSVSLPSFQPGDVALVITQGGGGVPTTPAGWTTLATVNNGFSPYLAMGYRVLQSGDTTTGTWTGASVVGVAIYRGVYAVGAARAQASVSNITNFTANQAGSPRQTMVGLALAAGGSAKSFTTSTLATSRTSGESSSTFGVADGTGFLLAEAVSGGSNVVELGSVGLIPDATFPIVADRDTTSGTQASNSTSWTLTYPTNIAAGDLLIAMVATDGDTDTTPTWPADWVYATQSQPAAATSLLLAKKSATGSETGSFTLTLPASEQGAWIIYRIPAGTWEGTLGSTWPNSGGASSGSVIGAIGSISASANPDPPSLDPTNWATENTLWIAATAVDTSRTFSGFPSGMTNTGSLVSGGSTGASLGWARLESAVSSYDPGTFTISTSDDWVAATIAIRPAAVVAPDPRRLTQILQLLAH